MKTIVVALGGNALGNTPEEQLKLVKNTAKSIVDLVSEGYNVVVSHGNGPQVGMINLAFAVSHENGSGTPIVPFPECGAMSQGYIGYHLQQAIQSELKARNINKNCASVVTQVLVDKKDPAFNNPEKPVGMFYTKSEAKKIEKEKGYTFVEDSGRGYRRVVPSPKPIEIVELDLIKDLLSQGNIVIASGGGGIPVVRDGDTLVGVDAVIDKDRSSSLLARKLNADALLILTTVETVSLKYNTIDQVSLRNLDISDAKKYIKAGEFAKGSMLPKVESCVEFCEYNKDGKGIITSLECAKEALLNETGTIITNSQKGGKKMAKTKKKRERMSAFTIIILLTIVVALVTLVLPGAKFDAAGEIVNGSGVVAAKLSDVLLAPIKGFENAVDVCVFILILGGFLQIVTKTGALENGIKVLVKKLKGNELVLIPILMIIFSIGGTTYGMMEETVGFYALLSFTMVAAGMDTIVASATVLLGAGCGVLGSTINPFATGAAVAALPEGLAVNQGILIALGTVLWLVSLGLSIFYVMRYARKVKDDKGSTFLSLQEQKKMEKFNEKDATKEAVLTGTQKATLCIFAITFIVMIIGFIPWEEFGITFFKGWTDWLTGVPLGEWYFYESAAWFLIVGILIGYINGFTTNQIIDEFIAGARDILSVVLIVAVARGVKVLMETTMLDNYIIYNVADALKGTPVAIFTPCNYILHVLLSILVPSSSGLATISTPIMAPLAFQLGYSVETTIMTFVAANGLVNLFTPTCGAIMGGLALAKVNYTTWLKWSMKLLVLIGLSSIVILTFASVILS